MSDETRAISQNAVYLMYNEKFRSVDYEFAREQNILLRKILTNLSIIKLFIFCFATNSCIIRRSESSDSIKKPQSQAINFQKATFMLERRSTIFCGIWRFSNDKLMPTFQIILAACWKTNFEYRPIINLGEKKFLKSRSKEIGKSEIFSYS